jgi:16S rRNA G527 N7-methylase RsmG
VKHRDDRYQEVAEWLGVSLDSGQRAALERYEVWLAEEAVVAGGIGRGEVSRLFDRHIADSLAFLKGMPPSSASVVDVGGGVGLPSIPMAIVESGVEFVLVDRSRRRTELARRASRILGLTNYAVRIDDIDNVANSFDVAVFRASLPIPQAAYVLPRCLNAEGIGLLGVSRLPQRPTIPNPPMGITFELSSEGDRILDSPFWLLKMRQVLTTDEE